MLSMFKTVVLLNIFVIDFCLGFFDEFKVQKNSIYLKWKFHFCNIINVLINLIYLCLINKYNQ